MDILTRLLVRMNADLIGRDAFGNSYYQEYKARPGKPPRRYVLYKGMVEASKVPAEWHGWLHHTEQNPPGASQERDRHDWEQEHMPNATGTVHAHRPKGHILRGGKRPPATGDYEPWTPQ